MLTSRGFLSSVILRWRAALAKLRHLDSIRVIRQSGLFDDFWYALNYPEVKWAGIDPIVHYICFGAAEKRNPGPFFNTAFYFKQMPPQAQKTQNPLIHYIKTGREAGLPINPAVSASPPQSTKPSAAKESIIVIEGDVPAFDTNAGARMFDSLIRAKIKLGYDVKLVFISPDSERAAQDIERYQRAGIDVYYPRTPEHDWKAWVSERAGTAKAFFIHRPIVAGYTAKWIKKNLGTPILYFDHDLHFLRLQREMTFRRPIDQNPDEQLKVIEYIKNLELDLMQKVDAVLVPSLFEVDYLKQAGIHAQFLPALSFDQDQLPDHPLPDGKHLLFVGSFRHHPNIDGLHWFLEEVWDSVQSAHPDVVLDVVGSGVPPELRSLASSRVDFHGWVDDNQLAALYTHARVAILPMRYGAGLKGKLLEAMFYGVPVVGTSISLEGCPDIDTVCSPADSAETFSADIARLLDDDAECHRRTAAGRELIERHFSEQALQDKLHRVLSALPQPGTRES
ncbi:MAG: glycosyltransferase family 4 protein [Anaerolineae bacterium]|nr:glycosyltransferase family 4 protein [Anaerolineae bacterium]